MHLVLQLCVVMAFSSSSRPVDFFNFFTRLFTAFSLHLSSPSDFFQPSNRLTIGGLKLDSIEVMICVTRLTRDPHRAVSTCHHTNKFPLAISVKWPDQGHRTVYLYRQLLDFRQRESLIRAAKTLPQPPYCSLSVFGETRQHSVVSEPIIEYVLHRKRNCFSFFKFLASF